MPGYARNTDTVLNAWAMKALHVYMQEHHQESGRIIAMSEPTEALLSDNHTDGLGWSAEVAFQDGNTVILSVIREPDHWYVVPV